MTDNSRHPHRRRPAATFRQTNADHLHDDLPIGDQQEIANSRIPNRVNDAWGNVADFCNESYREFIPRNEAAQQSQELRAKVDQVCTRLVLEGGQKTWEQLMVQNFPSANDARWAREYFSFVTRTNERRRSTPSSPAELLRELTIDLKQFVDLGEHAFTAAPNRDLVKLDALADLLRDYHNAERTYLLLAALPMALPEKAGSLIQQSPGYKAIMKWGASRFLKDFWHRLQQRFRITRVAIKNEAAQNLARELGETGANLRAQAQLMQARIDELEMTIVELRTNALHEAICQLAHTLQDRPSPALDQIFALQQWLLKQKASQAGSLSSELLRVHIAVQSIIEALAATQIVSFPTHLDQVIELASTQLNEFAYVEGTPFANSAETKKVICVRPGWRVGNTIVTPARVKEITP